MDALKLYDAGYTALVSVVPPGARVRPNSKISEKDVGKVPGLMGLDGVYSGYKWHNSNPRRDTLQQWVQQGASIGFLAKHYPAIDIDVDNEALANDIVAAVEKITGQTVVRVGRWPRQLMLFQCEEPLTSFDIRYSKWEELLGEELRQLVQFLGSGRQYVMSGIHPKTLQPYYVRDPLNMLYQGPAILPLLTMDKVAEVFNAIEIAMLAHGYEASANAWNRMNVDPVSQDDLVAPDTDVLRTIVSRLPNHFPDREDYIKVGYAIKGASLDHPDVGLELFLDWCERWEDGHNDPRQVERDWDKMTGPYRVGFETLVHLARKNGVNVADIDYGPGELPPDGATVPTQPPEVTASLEALEGGVEEEIGDQYSDEWLANTFVRKYRGKIMVANSGVYAWTGARWEHQGSAGLMTKVRAHLRGFAPAARMIENTNTRASILQRLGSLRTINAVCSLGMHSPELQVLDKELDTEPHLLGVANGVVDLRTGSMVPPDPAHKITCASPLTFDPAAKCPAWESFIWQVTLGREDLARQLQVYAGISISGDNTAQVLPYFVGGGRNGKTTFINIIYSILGEELAAAVGSSLFTSTREGGDVMYTLAKLRGKRLAVATEIPYGTTWNTARVKQLTGDDYVEGRNPYGKSFEFNSTATFLIAGNTEPNLRDMDMAIRRRIRVIPWDFVPTTTDTQLKDKLLAELNGILVWAVKGAMEWFSTRTIPEAKSVTEATEDYFEDNDDIGAWLKDYATFGREYASSSKELYDSYCMWARLNTSTMLYPKTFYQLLPHYMKDNGCVKTTRRTSGGGAARGWKGIKVEARGASNVTPFPAETPPK